MEKAYALQAGIGAIGKNGCLIIPHWGSFFFLSVILTNLELPPDQPLKLDICKSCSRCIDSCPTHCIIPDRTIDARRCISYLTIENKGEMPREQREKIGNWLFGCDVCQTVCPHNQNVIHQKKQIQAIANPILPDTLPLFPFFDLSEEAFKSQFKKTALYRSKREGMMRNAAIVIGNQKNPKALPILEKAKIEIKSEIVSEAISWAIEQITRMDASTRTKTKTDPSPPQNQPK
jgi:epoxyqueuosine reductase